MILFEHFLFLPKQTLHHQVVHQTALLIHSLLRSVQIDIVYSFDLIEALIHLFGNVLEEHQFYLLSQQI